MIKTTKGLLEFWEEQMRQSHRSSNYFFRKSPSHYHMMLIIMAAYKSEKKISVEELKTQLFKTSRPKSALIINEACEKGFFFLEKTSQDQRKKILNLMNINFTIKESNINENSFKKNHQNPKKYCENLAYEKANKNLLNHLINLNLLSFNKIVEYPVKSIEYLKVIAKKIKKFNGGLLTFDYGYTLDKNKNTLQSVIQHRYTNLFFQPGHSDITSHINFQLFNKILTKNNLDVKKIATQNEFLKKIGILERANILSEKMTFKAKANMFYRLKKLLDDREMGSLFKVLFAQKKGRKFSLGF